MKMFELIKSKSPNKRITSIDVFKKSKTIFSCNVDMYSKDIKNLAEPSEVIMIIIEGTVVLLFRSTKAPFTTPFSINCITKFIMSMTVPSAAAF